MTDMLTVNRTAKPGFKYGARNAGDVLEEIGQEILPQLTARQWDGE